MILLLLGMALWFIGHLLPLWAPDRRAALAAQLGEGPYKIAYALATVATVVLIVIGYQSAPYVALWTPPGFLVHLNNLLMIVAVVFFIGGGFPSHVRRAVRHPQLTGVKTWALAHLLVNGDLASLILFGGMLAWAVLALIGTNRRDGPRGPRPEATLLGLALHAGASLVVFGGIAWLHNMAGYWPFPGAAP